MRYSFLDALQNLFIIEAPNFDAKLLIHHRTTVNLVNRQISEKWDTAIPENRLIIKWAIYAILVLSFTCLYGLTAQRGINWQDGGHLQWRIINGDWLGDGPLAMAHPLYIGAAWFFTKVLAMSDHTFASNLFSALCMGLAVGNLFLITCRISQSMRAGIFSASSFGLLHAVWWLAAVTEVYAFQLLLLSLEILVFILWVQTKRNSWLTALFIVNGLGFSSHNIALLSTPILILAVISAIRNGDAEVKSLLTPVLGWFVGSIFILGPALTAILTGGRADAVIQDLLTGRFSAQVFNTSLTWNNQLGNLSLFSLNLASLLLPLALIGIKNIIRGRQSTGFTLLAYLLIHFIFFIRYSVPDQFHFALPTLFLLAAISGIGFSGLFKNSGNRRILSGILALANCLIILCWYWIIPLATHAESSFLARSRKLPYREEFSYWFYPWKHNENSASQFARNALYQLDETCVLLADLTAYYPLLVSLEQSGASAQYSPEILLFQPDPNGQNTVSRDFGNRKLYIVSPIKGYCPNWILEDAEVQLDGILYRVEAKQRQLSN